MTVTTIKFSQFTQANLANSSNSLVGISAPSGGMNVKSPFIPTWTTIQRPLTPFNGLLGFNSSLNEWEYWNGTVWVQFAASSGGINPGTAGQLAFYQTTGSTLSPLSTINNGVLVTNNFGMPSISTTLPSGLTIPGYAHSGNNADITSMLGLTGYLQAPRGIKDSNGNIVLSFNSVVSPVNYIGITNNATGLVPLISAVGTDTNIPIQISGKGTAGVNLGGTTSAIGAPAGAVGEVITSFIPVASAISLTNATPANVTSLSLPAGDWMIEGNINFAGNTTNIMLAICWSSFTSASVPDASLYNGFSAGSGMFNGIGISIPKQNYRFSSTTIIYLSCQADFGSGTVTACGSLQAQRYY